MQKITAIIPCKNEAANIEKALQSVTWCDEIMVVDSFSTDTTLEIAAKYTDCILQREYINSANQKNWAIPQAKHEWILLLDADEFATPELQKEIQSLLQQADLSKVAYWIHRRNYFMGKEVKYSGWQGDKVVRLFKRDDCRYEEKHVHAEIVTTGKIGKLKNKLVHNTYKGMSHYLQKWDKYSTWSAMDAARKVKQPGLYHFIIKPWYRFFKHYILDRGILDGRVGFIICSLAALGVFMRYVKLTAMRYEEHR